MLYAIETWLVAKVATRSAKTATTATNKKSHSNKSYFGKLKQMISFSYSSCENCF